MITKIRLMLCGLALTVLAGAVLRADPGPARTTGRILLLEGDRTLEGEIQREGQDYLVRRPVGELWVSGDRVLRLCATWREAYAYVRSQANLGDPDERLRLAHWCQLHGLRKGALAEATAAVQLRPGDTEARRLQSLLRRATAAAKHQRPAKPARQAAAAIRPLAPVDLSSDSLCGFTTRVQPILMNACASCHVGDRGGSFQLMRAYADGTMARRVTQHNLAAVMAQVDKERPQVSPLLVKAVSMHGGAAQAPLKSRQTPAFRHLEEWIEQTLADNPYLLEEPARAAKTSSGETGPVARRAGPRKPSESTEEVGVFQPAVSADGPDPGAAPVVAVTGPALKPNRKASGTAHPARQTPAAGPPKPRPAPADPFDPLIFNQQMHPEK
jgi:hypothetical protein